LLANRRERSLSGRLENGGYVDTVIRTMTKRRFVLVAFLTAVAIAGAAVGFGAWRSGANALAAPEITSTTSVDRCSVGELLHYGFVGFGPRGDSAIHFTAASLVGPVDGLEVAGIYAVKTDETPTGKVILAANEGDWSALGTGIRLHPVSDVVLDPTSIKSQWWLVALVRSRVASAARAHGVRIEYTVGLRSGVTTFPYEIAANCK
jgi:hypothetical protein